MRFFKIAILLAILFILMVIMVDSLNAEKIIDLEEILKPQAINAFGNTLYITEGTKVSLFNLEKGEIISSFGKQGEGPGEFKFRPRLRPTQQGILINSSGKVLLFSHQGDFLKEWKIQGHNSKFLPLFNNYAGRKNKPNEKDGKFTQTIGLFDKEFSLIKELYTTAMPGMLMISSSQKGKQPYALINDYIDYETYKGKLFIADTSKGFFIKVFDHQGNFLHDIKKEFDKVEVSETFKKRRVDHESSQPWFKRFKDRFEFVFPEYYPAFQHFSIADDKIFIQTYLDQDNREEFIILDLNGREISRIFLPRVINSYDPLYVIYNHNYYYLQEDEDKEMWSLYQVELDF